uniref:Arylsulfotransferase (ASST) n=1 Tax=Candidatus Kentrum sp. FM TaxID=2126340 RepID=A0A450TAM7_9GAMM|nr:MAG: Arylsulfotransferase (ASST) [Candidatus Kentron sp. FM]VFJ64584.1 MAG: Arylsulfotransferase (ASST) [Candidatus Kentron sp. FM]VFK15209.1 MAG: Arylsulfotransferase (ASST) [Candidatus Kentron sp. FM]
MNKIANPVFLICLFSSTAVLGGMPVTPLEFVSEPAIEVNSNPAVPLAAILTFETSTPVETQVDITAGDKHRRLEFGHRESRKQQLALVGFQAGLDHEIHVTISDAEGNAPPVTRTLVFTAPRLPTEVEEFPLIEIKRRTNAPMEPGTTLFNLRRHAPPLCMAPDQAKKYGESLGLLVAVDAAGDVIWYYRGDARISDFELLANGNIVFLTWDSRAVEIDLLGNVIAQWYAKGRPQGVSDGRTPVDTLTLHHDIDELPNGNFLVLGTTRRQIADYRTSELNEHAPRKAQWLMGDEVIEFERNGDVVWRWDAFDHLDVHRIGYETFGPYWPRRGFPETLDWSHANTVTPLDDGAILISFRHQSAVTKVDRRNGEIVWIAGAPSGWSPRLPPKLLRMKGKGKWFWHQHWPTMSPDGAMLIFDNAVFQANPFDEPVRPAQTGSRIVEYVLDEEAMTIEERWSSQNLQDPPVASFAMGSAQYLPETGNLLAGYGLVVSLGEEGAGDWGEVFGRGRFWSRIREYTHASPPEVVWELELRARENDRGLGWGSFGAKRVESFPPRR